MTSTSGIRDGGPLPCFSNQKTRRTFRCINRLIYVAISNKSERHHAGGTVGAASQDLQCAMRASMKCVFHGASSISHEPAQTSIRGLLDEYESVQRAPQRDAGRVRTYRRSRPIGVLLEDNPASECVRVLLAAWDDPELTAARDGRHARHADPADIAFEFALLLNALASNAHRGRRRGAVAASREDPNMARRGTARRLKQTDRAIAVSLG
jgi:hypothetical protein